MTRRGTNLCTHRWLAGVLLAAYGSAGVLGYGLHSIWPCQHDCPGRVSAVCAAHAHPHDDVHAHGHGHCCHHDHHHGPVVAAHGHEHGGTVCTTVDDCPICSFLVQAQSPFVLELATECVGPTSLIVNRLDSSYVAPLSGSHPARGPPLG